MGDSVRLSLSFRNVTGIVANFRQADKRLQREVRVAVKEAGEFMQDLAYFLAPVDTSYMRDHLQTEYSDGGLVFETGFDEQDFIGQSGYDGTPITAFYPILVEFGTVNMHAQPFLHPAYVETKAVFVQDIKDAVRRSLARGA